MKNTFQISKQQITYLHEISGDTTKLSLEEMFPEAFEPELKTGIWYKSKDKSKKCLTFSKEHNESERIGQISVTYYGFDYKGIWFDETTEPCLTDYWEVATEEEVLERLTEEAVKRGFKKGVTVDRKSCNVDFMSDEILITEIRNDNFSFNHYSIGDLSIDKKIIFAKGIWAEICITKEEAEKELGKKII